jgi:hypothetical protein
MTTKLATPKGLLSLSASPRTITTLPLSQPGERPRADHHHRMSVRSTFRYWVYS